jgi:hypothetical protein
MLPVNPAIPMLFAMNRNVADSRFWHKLLLPSRQKPIVNFPEIKVHLKRRKKQHHAELPLIPATITPSIHVPIDYSNYTPKDLLERGENPFNGILHYIYFHSHNCFNTSELSISFAGVQPQSDPINLFKPNDRSTLDSGIEFGQCLMIEFKRIRIRPTLMALRTPPSDRRRRDLKGFIFQGWQESKRKWIVLVEYQWHGGIFPLHIQRVGIIDTPLDFAKFRWLETDRTFTPGTFLALQAAEIHGRILVNEEPLGRKLPTDQTTEVFDPWAIPDYV